MVLSEPRGSKISMKNVSRYYSHSLFKNEEITIKYTSSGHFDPLQIYSKEATRKERLSKWEITFRKAFRIYDNVQLDIDTK